MSREFKFGGRAQALQDIKWLTDDQFKTRVFNFNHDVSTGDMPSETFGIGRYLPLRNEVYQGEGSYGKRRGLVMNHGTIVSAVNIFSDKYYASSGNGEVGIGVSGEMSIGKNVLGDPIVAKSQDSFRMYGNGCVSLLVPANGGDDVQDKYTALDVSHGRLDATGSVITAGSNILAPDGTAQKRNGNIPVGISQMTVWRDDVGEVLNYSTKVTLLESIQSDYFIKMPVVLVDRAYAILGSGPTQSKAASNAFVGTTANNNGWNGTGLSDAYKALVKWFSFAYMDEAQLTYGAFVKSDACGMYTAQNAAGSQVNASKTAQTVGKMFSLDNKFPKENQDRNLTFTNTKVTGSDTFGIPADLFIFAMEYVKASGITNPETVWDSVKALIDGAAIGHLKINIHVS